MNLKVVYSTYHNEHILISSKLQHSFFNDIMVYEYTNIMQNLTIKIIIVWDILQRIVICFVLPIIYTLLYLCFRYYSGNIIQLAGFPGNAAIWLTCIPTFSNFVFSLVGELLVDRIGRRKLILGSIRKWCHRVPVGNIWSIPLVKRTLTSWKQTLSKFNLSS